MTTTEPAPSNPQWGAWALLAGVVALWLLGGRDWILIIGGLAGVLFLHELGHYVAARATGMKVTEFFIGFGPKLWAFQRGETTYGIKALWAGAYVRIPGMNSLDKVDPADEPRSFRFQSYPRKIAVLLAGPAVHFVLAFILMFAVFAGTSDRTAHVSSTPWSLGQVWSNSPASEAGLRSGDKLLTFNSAPVYSFEDFANTVSRSANTEAVVTYERNGTIETTTITIGTRDDLEPDAAPTGYFGVSPEFQLPNRSLAAAAFETIDTFPRLVSDITVQFPVIVVEGFGDAFNWAIGRSNSPPAIDNTTPVGSSGGGVATEDQNRLVSIYGIASIGAQAASFGWVELVEILMVVNLFVGLFNLLPILPLDGGHAAIATYERLRSIGGRRYQVDASKLVGVTYAVVVFLVLTAGVTLIRDIIDPISLS